MNIFTRNGVRGVDTWRVRDNSLSQSRIVVHLKEACPRLRGTNYVYAGFMVTYMVAFVASPRVDRCPECWEPGDLVALRLLDTVNPA